MVLILLCLMLALGVSGWLCTTEWFWGYAEPLEVHAAIAWLCLGCIVLHMAGVIFSSLMHRENLVIAMITGRKRSAQGSDVG
jgi:cytochrome b